MNSLFKFPRRVRIHGGECGAVARALHHEAQKDALMSYERASLVPAAIKKALIATIERKQMSTKTTLKRIALVAVSALGFGLLSTVPVKAAEPAVASLSVGANTPARVGLTTSATVTARYSTAITESDTVMLAARVLTAPAGSGYRASVASGGSTDNDAGEILNFTASASGYTASVDEGFTPVTLTGIEYVAAYHELEFTAAGETAASKTVSATLNFVPDVEGTYTFLISAGDDEFTTGNKSTTLSITTRGAPSKVALTALGANADIDSANGTLIKVTLTDANGNVTMPGVGEFMNITSSDSDVDIFSAAAGSGEIAAIDSTNGFTTYGFGYFWAKTDAAATAAQTSIITVSGGGLLLSPVSASTTVTHRDAEAAATFYLGNGTTNATTAATTPAGYEFASATSFDVSPSQTSHIFQISGLTASSTAAAYYPVEITDESGTITGIVGAVYSNVLTRAAGTSTVASLTISASLGTSKSFQVGSIDLDGEAAVQDSVEIDQPAMRSAVGGSIAITATTYDQFGIEMPNVGVSFSVAGRNTVASTLKVSDADGVVKFSYTDAGTAASTNLLDTITATPDAGDDADVTVTFGAYTVGTVTVTGGATADTVAYPGAGSTTAAITTAAGGAGGATTTFTATVKDANGNILSGVPVTWSVDKATAGITKSLLADASSCITGTAGTCTTTVYSWAAPSKVTVTATAGGVSGTGYQNFINASSDARVLSATVVGNIVVAKVVDRYGNLVSSVSVSARTDKGYFGAGATSTSGNTGTDGTVGFVLLGNADSASVTVSVDSATYSQTDDLAGYVGATAVTAAVAGTSTGVGSSLAPAGVNSVTVAVAASQADAAANAAADAAAEAIDAANAATDAANLAAEAADAATVAAEEARDAADAATAAVEELATQVATLMAALKAQITTLANTVAKIAKKVKA